MIKEMDFPSNQIRPCPVCVSDKYTIWSKMAYQFLLTKCSLPEKNLNRHKFSKDSYIEIAKCNDCGMYYNRTYFNWAYRDLFNESNSNNMSEDFQPDEQIVKSSEYANLACILANIALQRKKTIHFKKADLKVLDYSCGVGTLLRITKSLGIKKVYGYDITEIPYLKKYGIKYFNDLALLKKCGPFDLIFNFSSLEHYDDPLKELQTIQNLLVPGGILLIGLPTLKYNRFDNYKKNNFDETFPRKYFHHKHINHFSVSLLVKILQKSGFKILPVTSACTKNPYYIDWMNRKSIFSAARQSIITQLRLLTSWAFYYFNFYPNNFRQLYFNGYFLCTRNDSL